MQKNSIRPFRDLQKNQIFAIPTVFGQNEARSYGHISTPNFNACIKDLRDVDTIRSMGKVAEFRLFFVNLSW